MGQAPASMGLADDLAARLAYESLSSLSGMASKVQETIEHNRRAFANQVALIDRQVMQKAMFAWRTWRAGKASKRDKLRRAMNRILRGTLSRGFYNWRDHLRENDKDRLMQRKVSCGWWVCLEQLRLLGLLASMLRQNHRYWECGGQSRRIGGHRWHVPCGCLRVGQRFSGVCPLDNGEWLFKEQPGWTSYLSENTVATPCIWCGGLAGMVPLHEPGNKTGADAWKCAAEASCSTLTLLRTL